MHRSPAPTGAGPLTLEEFEQVPELDARLELSKGFLVREPQPEARHGAATEPAGQRAAREAWRAALVEADRFARSRPADEAGCLYYSPQRKRFVLSEPDTPLEDQGLVPHWGRPGGVLPRPAEGPSGAL